FQTTRQTRADGTLAAVAMRADHAVHPEPRWDRHRLAAQTRRPSVLTDSTSAWKCPTRADPEGAGAREDIALPCPRRASRPPTAHRARRLRRRLAGENHGWQSHLKNPCHPDFSLSLTS